MGRCCAESEAEWRQWGERHLALADAAAAAQTAQHVERERLERRLAEQERPRKADTAGWGEAGPPHPRTPAPHRCTAAPLRAQERKHKGEAERRQHEHAAAVRPKQPSSNPPPDRPGRPRQHPPAPGRPPLTC